VTRVDGEEFGRAGLAVGVDDFDFVVELEVLYDGDAAVRVGGREVKCEASWY